MGNPWFTIRAIILSLLTSTALLNAQQGGVHGVPRIWSSAPILGTTMRINLEDAAPGSIFMLGFSISSGPTTLQGIGTFALGPDLTVVYYGLADEHGWGTLEIPLPSASSYRGLTGHWQVAVLDGSAPNNVAISTPLTTTLRTGRYVIANEGDAPGPGFSGVPGTAVVGDTATMNHNVLPTHFFPLKVALQTDCMQAYTVSRFGNPGEVLVFDPNTNQICTTLTVGPYPVDIAVSADDRLLWVLNGPLSPQPGSVFVYDTTTLNRVTTFMVNQTSFKLVPAGAHRALVLASPASVFVLDAEKNTVQGPISVRWTSKEILFDACYPPDGGPLVYVSAGEQKHIFPIPPLPAAGHLTAVDVARSTITGSVQVGTHPLGVAHVMRATGPALATVNLASQDATVVDRATMKVIHTIALQVQEPKCITAIGSSGRLAVVDSGVHTSQSPPSGTPGALELLDADTGRSLCRVGLPSDVQTSVAADTAGTQSRVYVLNRFAGAVDRFNGVSGARIDSLAVGKNPVFVNIR